MVSRVHPYYAENDPLDRPGTDWGETPHFEQDDCPAAPVDAYDIVNAIGWGLIALAGLMAVGYIAGWAFGCGFRMAFGL